MARFLNTRGHSKLAIAICARCSRKFPLDELRPDPNAPGLMVCADDLDDFDPWRLSPRAPDDISLAYARPDVSLYDFGPTLLWGDPIGSHGQRPPPPPPPPPPPVVPGGKLGALSAATARGTHGWGARGGSASGSAITARGAYTYAGAGVIGSLSGVTQAAISAAADIIASVFGTAASGAVQRAAEASAVAGSAVAAQGSRRVVGGAGAGSASAVTGHGAVARSGAVRIGALSAASLIQFAAESAAFGSMSAVTATGSVQRAGLGAILSGTTALQGALATAAASATGSAATARGAQRRAGAAAAITGSAATARGAHRIAGRAAVGTASAASVRGRGTSPGGVLATRTATNFATTTAPAGATYTIFHAFAQGDVPAGSIAVVQSGGVAVLTQQCDDRVTWPDGSLRSGVFTWQHPNSIAPSASDSITLKAVTGTWDNTPAVTASSIAASHNYQMQMTTASSGGSCLGSISGNTLTVVAEASASGAISGTAFTPTQKASFTAKISGANLTWLSGGIPAVGDTVFCGAYPHSGAIILSGSSPNFIVSQSIGFVSSIACVTATITGTFVSGQSLFGAGVSADTRITAYGVEGSFTVTPSQTVASTEVSAITQSVEALANGQTIINAPVDGTTIIALGPNTFGGPGTYTLSAPQTMTSQLIAYAQGPSTFYLVLNNEISLGTRFKQTRGGPASTSGEVWGDFRSGTGSGAPIQGQLWGAFEFDCDADGKFRVFGSVHCNKLVSSNAIPFCFLSLLDGSTKLLQSVAPWTFYTKNAAAIVDAEGREYFSGADVSQVVWAFPQPVWGVDPTTTGLFDAKLMIPFNYSADEIAAFPAPVNVPYAPNQNDVIIGDAVDSTGQAIWIGSMSGWLMAALLVGDYASLRQDRLSALGFLTCLGYWMRDPVTNQPLVFNNPATPYSGMPSSVYNVGYGVGATIAMNGGRTPQTTEDSSHAGCAAFGQYILSGRRWWLNFIIEQSAGVLGNYNPTSLVYGRNPTLNGHKYYGIMTTQDMARTYAWGIRDISHSYWLLPDDHPAKPYFLDLLLAQYNAFVDHQLDNPSWAALGLYDSTDFSGQLVTTGKMIGSISGDVFTVTTVTSGVVAIGDYLLVGATSLFVTVTKFLSGTGGVGDYQLSSSSASEPADTAISCATLFANVSCPWMHDFLALTVCTDVARGIIPKNHGIITGHIDPFVLGRLVNGCIGRGGVYRMGLGIGPNPLGEATSGIPVNGYVQDWADVYVASDPPKLTDPLVTVPPQTSGWYVLDPTHWPWGSGLGIGYQVGGPSTWYCAASACKMVGIGGSMPDTVISYVAANGGLEAGATEAAWGAELTNINWRIRPVVASW